MKYQIGDRIWIAQWDAEETHITCPDCGGTKRLQVTFFDGETVSIECEMCRSGYLGPQGFLIVHNRSSRAREGIIFGAEIGAKGVEYKISSLDFSTSSYWMKDECDVFTDREGADARGREIAAEHDARERALIQQKAKANKSWAWNASYHRREIKRLQQQIDHHRAQLSIAAAKAKEPDEASGRVV